MKKIYSIIALALSSQILFSGCSTSNSSNNKVTPQPSNQIQSDSSKSTSATNQGNNASADTTSNNGTNSDTTSSSNSSLTGSTNNTVKPNNGVKQQSSANLSKEDIQKYITMTKASIIKALGTNYKSQGSTVYFSNGLSFLGLSSNQSKPSIIKCNNTVKIAGIKNGMTFTQVEAILGKTNVITTYVGTKTNTAYKIQYTYGKSLLKVISFSKDGKNSYIEVCPL